MTPKFIQELQETIEYSILQGIDWDHTYGGSSHGDWILEVEGQEIVAEYRVPYQVEASFGDPQETLKFKIRVVVEQVT
mgnify:CR=1 FL=1